MLLVVLGALMALLLVTSTGNLVLMLAFLGLPLALVYAGMSTALVALLRPGRSWVALAHALALVLGVLAVNFWVK